MQFNIKDEYTKSDIESVIDILESELIGLKPVKNRIREIAALLAILTEPRLKKVSYVLLSQNPKTPNSFTNAN
jgi:ATP-dependent Lon protease